MAETRDAKDHGDPYDAIPWNQIAAPPTLAADPDRSKKYSKRLVRSLRFACSFRGGAVALVRLLAGIGITVLLLTMLCRLFLSTSPALESVHAFFEKNWPIITRNNISTVNGLHGRTASNRCFGLASGVLAGQHNSELVQNVDFPPLDNYLQDYFRSGMDHAMLADEPQSQARKVKDSCILQNLSGAEKALGASKSALEVDPLLDTDDGLYAPVFYNVFKFRRSYQMMEEVFRIHVYKDGYRPLFHEGYRTGIYASEGLFIDAMERGNGFTVTDPREAHMFFMPYSMKQMVVHLHDPHTRSRRILRRVISNYVDALRFRYPYWNASHGRDHFFVSCHDWALSSLKDNQMLEKNVVKVVCNADVTEGFSMDTDVSLPETYIHGSNLRLSARYIGGPDASQRPFLAFFAGQMHGNLRPILVDHWMGKDPSMKIFEVLSPAAAGNLSYAQYMRRSKYCICPRGFTVNSPRLVEAIYYLCVPVIIADDFVLPFSDVLNWSKFSVSVFEREVPNLKNILTSIPKETHRSMQNKLKYVRRHFLWHEKPIKYDIFNMIVHSLWIQRLKRINLQVKL